MLFTLEKFMSEHYATLEKPKETYAVYLNGEKVAESSSVIVLSEFKDGKAFKPLIYFPMDCLSNLTKTGHTSFCPIKGTASYWSLGDAQNAIWSYEDPMEGVQDIKGYAGFDLRKGFEITAI